ncbi:hypothetical protein VTL71DRAFT_11468 [Oculimacula yallundae]|uniref:CENP-V/GFA domain-containing protein n=1 Tax=Oculimacula yallundae TaxID=86028 RepID=A0ABR4CQ98_9HELO
MVMNRVRCPQVSDFVPEPPVEEASGMNWDIQSSSISTEIMTQSSCLCGSNVIIYGDSPIVKFRCHCLDERKLTGAAFALNILFSTADLKVVKGELSVWGKTVESGNKISNHSCSQCGSLLYRTSEGYPGTMVIKAGCIDLPDGRDPSTEYIPDVEIFTRSRVPWISPIASARQDWGDFTSL